MTIKPSFQRVSVTTDVPILPTERRKPLWTSFGQVPCFIFAILLLATGYALIYMFLPRNSFRFQSYFGHTQEQVNVAMVACGPAKYLPTLLKSLVLFGQDERIRLNLILFTDRETLTPLKETMTNLTAEARKHLHGLKFTYELHPTWFPSDSGINWRSINKPCATQRLFFGSILKHIDSLIYLDEDSFVLGNLLEIWRVFSRMSNQQMIAVAPDNAQIYNLNKGHPYVEPVGLNTGVLLMNLTRLREFQFEKMMPQVYQKWMPRISFGDQDLINIFGHDNPGKIYVLPCSFNFIIPRCAGHQGCENSEGKGVLVAHGAGGVFAHGSIPHSFFSWIYLVFKQYHLSDDPKTKLLDRLEKEFVSLGHRCGSISPANLTQNAAEYFENLKQRA